MNIAHLNTPNAPNWCPGCGDFGIWSAFKMAAEEAGWNNDNTVIVAGIGCHGHIVNFVELTSFEGLHGRPLPVAEGIKLANHKLNVVVFTGDGDMLAEGGNHFIHACRRNHDLTIILHDNAVYGLTTGQTSPASPKGYQSKSTPRGSLEEPLHPLTMAIASGATFASRAYSGDIPRLADMMRKAVDHKGLAIVDILQPCQTFNKEYTHLFFQQNTYHLDEKYNVKDKAKAFEKSLEWGLKQIPLGVLYDVDQPTYEGQIDQIKEEALVDFSDQKRDIGELMKKYQ